MFAQKFVTSDPWSVFFLATACLIPICSLVYNYFELPILKYKDRFSSDAVRNSDTNNDQGQPAQKWLATSAEFCNEEVKLEISEDAMDTSKAG